VPDSPDEPVVGDECREDCPDTGAHDADAAEIEQRVVRLCHLVQSERDVAAVAERAEVRLGLVGPWLVGDSDYLGANVVFHALDGQFSFDTKAVGSQRESLERLAGERAVAAENVLKVAPVDETERVVYQPVAESVEPCHRARLHVGGPVADDVLGVILKQRFEHLLGLLWTVRRVAVDHQHDRLVDHSDSLADRLSLAAPALCLDACARVGGHLSGSVGRVAVHDENVSEPLGAKPLDDLVDGLGLVVRRNQDTHLVTGSHHLHLCWYPSKTYVVRTHNAARLLIAGATPPSSRSRSRISFATLSSTAAKMSPSLPGRDSD